MQAQLIRTTTLPFDRQSNELIAAEPRDDVGFGVKSGFEAGGGSQQRAVTFAVAESVVNALQAVEIGEKDQHVPLQSMSCTEALAGQHAKCTAIVKARKLVPQCQIKELFLHALSA